MKFATGREQGMQHTGARGQAPHQAKQPPALTPLDITNRLDMPMVSVDSACGELAMSRII